MKLLISTQPHHLVRAGIYTPFPGSARDGEHPDSLLQSAQDARTKVLVSSPSFFSWRLK